MKHEPAIIICFKINSIDCREAIGFFIVLWFLKRRSHAETIKLVKQRVGVFYYLQVHIANPSELKYSRNVR